MNKIKLGQGGNAGRAVQRKNVICPSRKCQVVSICLALRGLEARSEDKKHATFYTRV